MVDDDLDTLEFLQFFLSTRGLDVVAFDRHDGVIEAIRDIKPGVMLLDLQTPEDRSAGLRILAQLRADEATARVPVILMSSDHAALARHAAHLQELDARPLVKPFDLDRLLHLIEQAMA